MIPGDLRSALETSLGAIRSITPVGGGDINAAARVETPDARYFVKWNFHPRPRMFEAEARGLKLLAAANALRVPRVDRRDRSTRRAGAGMDRSGIEQDRRRRSAGARPRATTSIDARRRTASITTTTSARLRSATLRPDRGSSSIAINGWAHSAIWRSSNGHLTPDRARRLDRVMDRLDQWIDDAASVAIAAARRSMGRQLPDRCAGRARC